ncbi:MAG: gliding motility protein GldN [Bacteroidota bacterium]
MRNMICLLGCFLCSTLLVIGQPTGMIQLEEEQSPLDDIVESATIGQKRVLAYPPIREADILWKKRIWRVIDTREKMNLPFRYPKMPFINILLNEIETGNIKAYSTEDDAFTLSLNAGDLSDILVERDTVEIIDPVTGEPTFQAIENRLDPTSITRYRMKEIWFFDSNSSSLRVRILGMAPIQDVYDDNGNFKYSKPLFWIYYPDCRQAFAKYKVFNSANDQSVMTWEDHLEMRFFSSYITKESNVNDLRLEDYLSGRDLLIASERIKQELFNKEQDMWSY